jgi:hypothetical protein
MGGGKKKRKNPFYTPPPPALSCPYRAAKRCDRNDAIVRGCALVVGRVAAGATSDGPSNLDEGKKHRNGTMKCSS